MLLVTAGGISHFAHAGSAIPRDIAATVSDQGSKLADSEKRISVLEARIDIVKDYAALSQKHVDWWLAGLAMFMAVIGVAVPLGLTWTLRSNFRMNTEEAQRAAAEADKSLKRIGELLNTTEQHAGKAERIIKQLDDVESRIRENSSHENEQKKNRHSNSRLVEDEHVISQVLNDPDAPEKEKLRARALAAENMGDWENAAAFWQVLVAMDTLNLGHLLSYTRAKRSFAYSQPDNIAVEIINQLITKLKAALNLFGTEKFGATGYETLSVCLFVAASYEANDEEASKILNEAIGFIQQAKFDSVIDQAGALSLLSQLWDKLAQRTSNASDAERFSRLAVQAAEECVTLHSDEDALTSLAVSVLNLRNKTDSTEERNALRERGAEILEKFAKDNTNTEQGHIAAANYYQLLMESVENRSDAIKYTNSFGQHIDKAVVLGMHPTEGKERKDDARRILEAFERKSSKNN